jgi:hypothetical protein
MTEISVDVQDVMPGDEGFQKALKISCDQWEINIWLTERDVGLQFEGVQQASGHHRVSNTDIPCQVVPRVALVVGV